MSGNIGLMREKKARLEAQQTNLKIEAKGIARDIPVLLNPTLTSIEEMDVARAATMIDDLVVKQAELLSLRVKLWEIGEALGE